MILVVSDANIMIDIVKLDILQSFFSLNIIIYTTDLILYELYEEQQEKLVPFIDSGHLRVLNIDGDQLAEVITLAYQEPYLSQEDCSAFCQARSMSALLLTSDGRLRKYATQNDLEVHGHLWILDQMVEHEIILGHVAITKLKLLNEEINPRLGLPMNECEKRIKRWSRT